MWFARIISLRFLLSTGNLNGENEKNRLCGAVFLKVFRVCGSLNRGNWLLEGAVTKTCSFSLALTGA